MHPDLCRLVVACATTGSFAALSNESYDTGNPDRIIYIQIVHPPQVSVRPLSERIPTQEYYDVTRIAVEERHLTQLHKNLQAICPQWRELLRHLSSRGQPGIALCTELIRAASELTELQYNTLVFLNEFVNRRLTFRARNFLGMGSTISLGELLPRMHRWYGHSRAVRAFTFSMAVKGLIGNQHIDVMFVRGFFGYTSDNVQMPPHEFYYEAICELLRLNNRRDCEMISDAVGVALSENEPAIMGVHLSSIGWDEIAQAAQPLRDLINHINRTPAPTPTGIGDTSCKNNALSRHLRCAINPCGPCEGCADYEPHGA